MFSEHIYVQSAFGQLYEIDWYNLRKKDITWNNANPNLWLASYILSFSAIHSMKGVKGKLAYLSIYLSLVSDIISSRPCEIATSKHLSHE